MATSKCAPIKKNAPPAVVEQLPALTQAPKSVTPGELLQLAVQQNLDIEKLEKLMELQERWEATQAKKQYMEAFTRFQQIVPVIPKNRTAKIDKQGGGSYSYSYADLAQIGKVIQPALKDTGLSYRFKFAQLPDGKTLVSCLISHIGGHTEVTDMESEKDTSGAKSKIQQSGSTNTFLQRYSLIGALGLTTAEEDIDGAKIPGKVKPPKGPEGMEDEDFVDQWKQAIDQVKTKLELNKLYTQNQAAVDANPKVQSMMKAKQETFKAGGNGSPVNQMR